MNQRGKITLLMLFFSVCGTAALVNYYLQLRVEQVRPVELYEVVNSQLSAFRADDFSRAYQHASTSFQQKFNVGQFTAMIRTNYAGIVDAERVEYGTFECRGHRAMLQVFFIDGSGRVTPCIYNLIIEGDGWKIDGARILESWPTGSRLGGIRS